MATSATQNHLSETVGDEFGDVPPTIQSTVGELRDTTSSTFPATIPASSGAVQEALGRPLESVSVDPEGMLSLLQPSREKSDRLEVRATESDTDSVLSAGWAVPRTSCMTDSIGSMQVTGSSC